MVDIDFADHIGKLPCVLLIGGFGLGIYEPEYPLCRGEC